MRSFLIIAMASILNVCTAEQTDDRYQGEVKYLMAAWLIEVNQITNSYVNHLDEAEYVACWLEGDPLFQRAIAQQEWVAALDFYRKHLGNRLSRTLQEATPYHNLIGLPEGHYMIVKYQSSFERAPQCQEVLTVRRAPDGRWSVLSYHIR